MIYRCRACGHFFHPPGPACCGCRSIDVGPQPVSGRATVAVYTVNCQPWIPGLDPPYIVAMVDSSTYRPTTSGRPAGQGLLCGLDRTLGRSKRLCLAAAIPAVPVDLTRATLPRW
ncbi:Zn-ribbon domain-containing OB-fold protein [Mycobacterium arosiense]|uniref:Zn-ribbon domain-containing OB-fold protein n=1 Tax=Mycobacterium arosiense TaxID=425468 RepID=UPI0034D17515